jgi:hypothetical protein
MQHKEDFQKEVDLTLNSFDGASRAEAPAFFYTRLIARMESVSVSIWSRWAAILARPAVSLGILFIFLLMNGYLILSNLPKEEESHQQDYISQQITYFDTNSPNP